MFESWQSIGDEVSDEADYEISIKGESQGSNASIRTSIFQGDGDEDDITMEERSGLLFSANFFFEICGGQL